MIRGRGRIGPGARFGESPRFGHQRRNLLVYGAGGIVVPFIGIKLIDVVVTAIGLA